MSILDNVAAEIKNSEGTKFDRKTKLYIVYLDNLGNPTVGFGHLVRPEDHLVLGDTITQAQADAFLKQDLDTAIAAARAQASAAGISDDDFITALASVNFQPGSGWIGKLTNTWQAILSGNYEEAADEAANSQWNSQSPKRVKDFPDALLAYAKAHPAKPAAVITGTPPWVRRATGHAPWGSPIATPSMHSAP